MFPSRSLGGPVRARLGFRTALLTAFGPIIMRRPGRTLLLARSPAIVGLPVVYLLPVFAPSSIWPISRLNNVPTALLGRSTGTDLVIFGVVTVC